MNSTLSDFLAEKIFDEISFEEFGIKPIEAATWIIFLIFTLMVIININYLTNFIDFGIKMIISAILVAYFIKVKNGILS